MRASYKKKKIAEKKTRKMSKRGRGGNGLGEEGKGNGLETSSKGRKREMRTDSRTSNRLYVVFPKTQTVRILFLTEPFDTDFTNTTRTTIG